jgi:hypothetical protein
MEVSGVKTSPPWKRDKFRLKLVTEHMSKYRPPKEQKRLKVQNRYKRAISF